MDGMTTTDLAALKAKQSYSWTQLVEPLDLRQYCSWTSIHHFSGCEGA